MANQYVNKLVKDGVTKFDLTNDTVTPETLAKGVTAHDASGAQITGTMENYVYYVPDGTTEIASTTIPDKTKWFKIVLPASVTIIGDNAFDGCTNLSVLDIKGTITAIGDYAFRSTKLSEFTFPNGISKISDSAFRGCYMLRKIVIPDSVVSIGKYAFYNCYRLITINGGINVKTIGDNAFNNCRISYSSIINNFQSLEEIGYSAFFYCIGNTRNPQLPSSIKLVESQAFEGCRLYGELDLSNSSIEQLHSRAFGQTNISKVILSPFITDISLNPFTSCLNLRDIDTGSNSYFSSYDGSLYSSDRKKLISWAMGKDPTNIVIPEGVTIIGSDAFSGHGRMTSVQIPDSVMTISSGTFGSFSGCFNLKTITINRPQDSISGAPWGATNATVVWTG